MRLCADSVARFGKRPFFGIALFFAVALAAQDSGQSAREVKYVSHDEDGRKTMELRGDAARVLANGDIEIENLRMTVFGPGGEAELKVAASDCVYRANDNVVESDARVRLERENVVVSGRGFRWSAKDGLAKISREARVELANSGKLAAVGLKLDLPGGEW